MVAYRKGLIKELDNHDAGTGTSGVPPDTCGTFMSANDTKYNIGSALQEIENVQGCIEIANRDILKTLSNIYTLIHLDK